MVSSKGKFLALAIVLMLAVAPVMADDHLNETDEDDSDGTDNSTALSITRSEAEQTANLERVEVQNLKQARERIEELRGMVVDLRRELEKKNRETETEAEQGSRDQETETDMERERNGNETETEAEQGSRDQETKADMERERNGNETKTEGEVERPEPPQNRGPSQNAREAVNETPGNQQAQERRPGFVSNLLSSFFG